MWHLYAELKTKQIGQQNNIYAMAKDYSSLVKDEGNEKSAASYHLCVTLYIPVFSDSTMNYFTAFSTNSCEP